MMGGDPADYIDEEAEFEGAGLEDNAAEVQKLEKEIEEVLRNRISTAEGLGRHKYNY